MFAGPNGSGKSIIKQEMPEDWLGIYLNPDEIQKEIAFSGHLDIQKFGVDEAGAGLLSYFRDSGLLRQKQLTGEVDRLHFSGGRLHFGDVEMNAYYASVLTDWLRQ